MNHYTIATYDNARERWRFYWDSYQGGESYRTPTATTLGAQSLNWRAVDANGVEISNIDRRNSYLVPHDGESDVNFDKRVALAAYINVVQPIVKAYAEGVTSGVNRTLDALGPVVKDVDRRGSAWGEFAEECARWAALFGLVYAVVDTPNTQPLQTRADELTAGVKPYVVLVQPTAVAWTKVDAAGQLIEFAYTDTPYESRDTSALNPTACVRVRCWVADHVNERGESVTGGWYVFEGEVSTSAGMTLSGQRDKLQAVESGPLAPVLKGKIPVTVCYYERDSSQPYPMGMSLVTNVVDLARLIYNQLSWINEIHRKSGFPFLAIPLSSTGGQLDAATAVKVGPSQGLGYNSNAGAPQWIQPSAESTKELREHAAWLIGLAYREAGLEISTDQSAQVQSGEALRLRSREYESRASKFARSMQRWEESTLMLVAALQGTSADVLQVGYPKRFVMPDLREDLERALALLTAPVEIGENLRAAAVRQIADSALSLTDEQLNEAIEQAKGHYARDVSVVQSEAAAKVAESNAKIASVAAPTAPDTTVEKAADTALNGAQMSSMKEIVVGVAVGELPRDSGIAMLMRALNIDAAEAAAIMGSAGAGFVPKTQESTPKPATADALPQPTQAPVEAA